jgi:hypothetical protein
VGGISTIVKDHINGMTFGLNATVDEYCHYIVNTFSQPNQYQTLAHASRNEFDTRLNWKIAANNVSNMISELI